MKSIDFHSTPIQGKTFTLFGDSDSTGGYYLVVRNLADIVLRINPDINSVIEAITDHSSRKRFLKSILRKPVPGKLISDILNTVNAELSQFTQNADQHLKDLSLSRFWDRTLRTTREQYHLYMLEIELTNRMNAGSFKACDMKIALLPHCLRDLTVKCKSAKTGFDYQCRHCSVNCYQHVVSSILNKSGIEPYIWMGGDFKRLARAAYKEGKSFGVFGMACIPELVMGMRKCRKHGIPVVGIPLNANRCIRWFGEFYPNSVDLMQVEQLTIA